MAGLNIRIEYRRGETRTGTGVDGKKWERKMHAHYGHITRTKGTDGDELDVYIGPESDFDTVYAITQLKAPEFKAFDEQKFMLGFKDAAAAKACYLKHYPDPKIFGGMKTMPYAEFEAKAMNEKNHGKKIAADQRRFVEMNLHLLPRGEKVAAAQVMGGPGAAALSAQFSAERGVPSPFVADLGGGADFMQYPRPGGGRAVHSRSGSGFGFKTAAEERRPSVMPRVLGGVLIGAGILGGARLLRAAHHDKLIADSMSSVARSGAEGVRALSGPRKKIAADRVGKIEDRLDDVGLSILAAPYVARGVAKHLAHRPGRIGAVGRAAQAAADAMHKHENKMEVAGLALVAPGVIKPLAKRLDKTLPAAKTATLVDLSTEQLADLSTEQLAALEKVAAQYIPDFEYMTETEKLASLAGMLGTVIGKTQGAMRQARVGIQGMATDFRNARAAAQQASGIRSVQRARDFRVGMNQGARTVPVTGPVRSGADASRMQRIAEQRQALDSYRQSKGLGTSAERAAANRAARAPTPVPQSAPAPAAAQPSAPAGVPSNTRAPAVPTTATNSLQATMPNTRVPAPVSPAPVAGPVAGGQYARPAQPAANAAVAPAAAPAAAQVAEPGIIDTLHGYLPQGTPRWAVPAAMAGAGGLLAGGMLFGGNKQSALDAIPLELKLAALNVRSVVSAGNAAAYARPKSGFFRRMVGSAGPTNTPGATVNAAQGARATAAAEKFKKPGVAASGAPGAAAETPMLSMGNMAKATGIGIVGLGLYGGKKAIDAGASLAEGHRHITPAPTPYYDSVVR